VAIFQGWTNFLICYRPLTILRDPTGSYISADINLTVEFKLLLALLLTYHTQKLVVTLLKKQYSAQLTYSDKSLKQYTRSRTHKLFPLQTGQQYEQYMKRYLNIIQYLPMYCLPLLVSVAMLQDTGHNEYELFVHGQSKMLNNEELCGLYKPSTVFRTVKSRSEQ
jgi:hypothetical protein